MDNTPIRLGLCDWYYPISREEKKKKLEKFHKRLHKEGTPHIHEDGTIDEPIRLVATAVKNKYNRDGIIR